MARAAFVLQIKPERVDDYVREHAAVWPEMRAEISAAGIHNYSIYLYGTQAIGFYEVDDPEAARAYLAKSEVNARWQEFMADLLEKRVTGGGPEVLPEVFRLD
jgi:L-rhamnose mutarotase